MNKKIWLLLVTVILLGSFLRLYQLNKFPYSLFGDEVDVGYQAYSILKTGKDYMGQPWPVSFHSLADWRTPLFLYSAVPSVAFFGLNEWGVRFPAAFFGIISLPIFFLLVRKIFKNDVLGVLACFFLAVSMWHLQYSRAAFEVTQMLFLFLTGYYLFLKGLERWPYLLASAVALALTPYSYNTAKFFLPCFGLIIIWSYWREIKKINCKRLFLAGLIFILVSLPMGWDIAFGKAGERFSILSIFSDPTVVPQIGFERLTDMQVSLIGEVPLGTAPSFSARFFHNKFLSWSLTLLKNYFQVFSTSFLFLRGDINYRHSVQGGFGEFYWLDSIFLLCGLYFWITRLKNTNAKKFWLGWLLLAPIPSALTRDGGEHATRLILLLPPMLVLISYGAYILVKIVLKDKRRLIFLSALGLVFVMQIALYLHRYYVHYPIQSEEWWHGGFKEISSYIKENEAKYDYIVISDDGEPPLIFSLFWLKIDPKIFQENKLAWTKLSDAIMADHLPGTKYYFGHVAKERVQANGFAGTIKPNMLYLMSQGEIKSDFRFSPVPPTLKLLNTVYFPSGRVNKYAFTGL